MTPNDIKADTQLIYLVEGEPYVGKLSRWAKAMEEAHYAGFEVSDRVWIVDNSTGATFTNHKPEQYGKSAYDDYVTYYYKLGEQEATVRIDERA